MECECDAVLLLPPSGFVQRYAQAGLRKSAQPLSFTLDGLTQMLALPLNIWRHN